MTRELAIVMLLAGMVLALVGLVLARTLRDEQRVAMRLLAVQRSVGVDQVAVPWSFRRAVLQGFGHLGSALTRAGILSPRTVADLEQTLSAAGFRSSGALPVFLGAKIVMLVAVPLFVFVLVTVAEVQQPMKGMLLAMAAVAGMLIPDFVAKRLRKRYLKELEQGLPDALDLMVICTEAGLSLEGAIDRVAVEIAPANRSIAAELSLCGSELRILADRRAALMNMAERTRLDVMRRVAVMLAQSLQFGTPITVALRTLSHEMRGEQLTRFEARAARLPVLLTVPMIVFILPTLFLVVGGPAILQVLRSW
ncbi:type II secretion system F family protein [Roseomonas stagni]|uniref:Type II secretion system F family protein n=1 Tax=Falsiroseomonas algicola TaxID=2716930 RepID=A0A6M1LNX9_9PROT|nr:type II secretion system F family protein [Falsiroseomonas algicola]NGM22070.1 type II secretion system F family protein [Falsiroseomonas algicola]